MKEKGNWKEGEDDEDKKKKKEKKNNDKKKTYFTKIRSTSNP